MILIFVYFSPVKRYLLPVSKDWLLELSHDKYKDIIMDSPCLLFLLGMLIVSGFVGISIRRKPCTPSQASTCELNR